VEAGEDPRFEVHVGLLRRAGKLGLWEHRRKAMAAITVSRQYGSEGRTVGLKAAKALGYLYMGKELIEKVALEAEVPVSEVECFDENPEHPVMRALRKFLAPTYPGVVTGVGGEVWGAQQTLPLMAGVEAPAVSALDEDAYVRLTQRVMLHLATQGNVVLMGRGGQAHLAHRMDVLHVRVVAPNDYRLNVLQERDGLSKEEAAREIRRADEQRRRYLRRHYGIRWASPEHYHLVINTGRTGVDAGTRLVVEAARSLPVNGGVRQPGG